MAAGPATRRRTRGPRPPRGARRTWGFTGKPSSRSRSRVADWLATSGHPDQRVAPHREAPAGGDRGILLADGAGRGVPRVRVSGLALGLELLVERREGRAGHVHLAPGFERVTGRIGAQGERDGADGPQVGGDVLAGVAIAPGRAARERSTLVAEADRQAVDLQLADVGHARIGIGQAQALAHPGVELAQLVGAEGVAQREHRDRVPDLGEAGRWRRPHPLGGRIRGQQLRMGNLELLQLPEEAVVLGVGDGRRVQDVVAVVRLLEGGAQLRRSCGRLSHPPLRLPPRTRPGCRSCARGSGPPRRHG